MRRTIFFALTLSLCIPVFAHAQELVSDTVVTMKAKVVEVVSQERKQVPGTDVQSTYQTIRLKFSMVPKKGRR